MLKNIRINFPFFIALMLLVVSSMPAQADVRTLRDSGMDVRASFSDVVTQASPAVVNIFAEKIVRGGQSPFAADPFFQMLFGNNIPGVMRDRVEKSLGSGVIVSADGIFVTNYHVVKDASNMRVMFNDGREVEARLVNADPKTDIAVMQIELEQGERVPFVEMGDSDTLQVGDVVLAVGNPFGVGQSVSMGIVSAMGRSNLGLSEAENFIQTDAAINPGNSGGALVDSNGVLMGINTAIYSQSGGNLGIGFATPVNVVKAILDSIEKTGRVERAWLGALGQNMTSNLAQTLGLDSPHGFLINRVMSGSPAANAGLKVGDIILALNEHEVKDESSLNARLREVSIDAKVQLTIWRGGQERTLPVRLATLPERNPSNRVKLDGQHPLRGFVVEKITPRLAQDINLPLETEGVVVVGAPSTLMGLTGRATLRPGDLLIGINNAEIRSLKDVQRALSKRARMWEIVFNRKGRMYRLVLQ